MHADLERLVALQQLDSTADEARRRLAEEPERQQKFEEQLAAAKQQVDVARGQLSQNQEARRTIEKDVAVQQGRLSKFRDQLMSVKTNVEYQAMQKEIEFAQNEVKTLEDRVLESMLEADGLSGQVEQAEASLSRVQREIDAERRTLEKDNEVLRKTVERLSNERHELVSTLDARIVQAFELVASRRNGVAVAEARDGICTICHVRLRPQVFNNVRKSAEMIQCDSCQRFLYFVPSQLATDQAQPAS